CSTTLILLWRLGGGTQRVPGPLRASPGGGAGAASCPHPQRTRPRPPNPHPAQTLWQATSFAGSIKRRWTGTFQHIVYQENEHGKSHLSYHNVAGRLYRRTKR